MIDPEKSAPPPVLRTSWRKFISRGGLAVIVFSVIFHRPILVAVVRSVFNRMAAHENVRLSFGIEGDPLNGLRLKDVKVIAVGSSPVDLISIGSFQARFNPTGLLRHGFGDFVTGYHLRDATLIFSPDSGTKEQKQELLNVARYILRQPALFSDHMQVENFSLTIHTPEGPFVLRNVYSLLDSEKPGFIKAGELAIPGLSTWHNLNTPVSYIGRHLLVRDFAPDPEFHVVRLELDGSQWGKGISYLSFKGTLLGGDVDLYLWRRRIDRDTADGQVAATITNLPLRTVHDLLRWKADVSGTVSHVSFQLAGNPDVPSQWEGYFHVQTDTAVIAGLNIDHAAADLVVTGGVARMDHGEFLTGGNRLLIRMEHRLPQSVPGLLDSGFEASLMLEAPELSKLYSGFSAGAVRGEGKCRVSGKEFTMTVTPSISGISGVIGAARLSLQSGTAQFQYSYDIHRRAENAPWFEGSHATLAASGSSMRLGDYAVDSGSIVAGWQEGKISIKSAGIHRGPNTIAFDGQYDLPTSLGSVPAWADTVFDVRFNIDVPTLASFSMDQLRPPLGSLTGSVKGSGEVHRARGETSGHGSLEARDLVFQQFTARHLAVNVPVAHNAAQGITFQLDINGKDQINGHGSLDLRAPFNYEGQLSGSVHDLGIFQPLMQSPVGGSLELDWHGFGQLQLLHHEGRGRIAVSNARMGNFTGIDGEIDGNYSPENIKLDTFRVHSDQGLVQAGIELHDQRLHVEQLRLQIGTIATVTGTFSLPMDLRTPTRSETVFPSTGVVDGTLTLDQLDLSKVISLAKPNTIPAPVAPRMPKTQSGAKPSPIPPVSDFSLSGALGGSITAKGTLGEPELTAVIHGHNLQALAAKQLPPCASTIALALKNNRLDVNGVIAQPGISPLQFTGAMPLSLNKVFAERQIDPSTPIALAVRLPPSSANLLAQVVPQIRYAEGQITINASAVGTLASPVFAGGLTLNLPAIRFQNADAPGIGNFRGDLRFSGNQLTFQEFQGDVSGGPFAVTGRVNLEHVTDPQLDLHFRSQGTLLIRNDSLTLRVNSDLKIAGPLNSARVTGQMGITKSRFSQEVEIVPISLAVRPVPKHAPSPARLSIESPPFRGWSFDITGRTIDPFVIRGNLTNGLAQADLHLGGSGIAPTMDGVARIENLVASLPFSRLNVDYGNLYYSDGLPPNPALDIHGTSRIRDYDINVYIYGTASEPQTLFTSEPPLAQEEIIALLATGVTSQELLENNQALAGRAGVLLLQNFYHKIFKRPKLPPSNKRENPRNRFSLDVGTVDPRTGRQELTGRFKLTDQYELGAGVDVQGDVQAQVRYLLRFR